MFAKAAPLDVIVPGWYRFIIGDMAATIISDGILHLASATAQFPDAPPDEIARMMQYAFLRSNLSCWSRTALS
jgi:hypothetical protein